MNRPRRQRPLDLLLIIPSLHLGGAERVAALVTGCLADRHRVALALFDASAQRFPVRCPVIALDLPAAGTRWGKACTVVRRIIAIHACLRRTRPQRIVSFMESASIPTIVAAALAGFLQRTAVSIRVDPGRIAVWQRAIIRTLYRLPAAVVAVSADMRRQLVDRMALPARRVATLPNPLDLSRLRAAAALPPVAEEVPRRFILGVGRLEAQKGFDLLIEAFALLRTEADLHLVILGDGPELRDLQRCAVSHDVAERVRLPGSVPDPWAWMGRCAAFALSSRYEGWPNALGEAMACGAPVAAFDCPTGPREMIEHGVNGLLVPPGDAAQMASALRRLISDPTLAEGCAASARRWSERFAVEAISERWLDLRARSR
jgi:GalNAc-alpha-(1->4)-GalNAc-alpha-(1->3)-diNAcBac-PP-undecaprenol alpha-1,4-N-acetyl-D-galactosaminyltransferase